MRFKQAIIIYNPTAGRVRDWDRQIGELQSRLEQLGVTATAEATTGPGDATLIARRVSRGAGRSVESAEPSPNVDLIIACGGDGTINEVLQGMVGSETSLAIYPRGTANVLARDLGLPFAAEQVALLIAAGRQKRVTIGRAGERFFFLMAGIGLDASIVNHVNRALKRRIGLLAYWVSGFRHLIRWRPEQFTLRVAGADYRATFAAIGNSESYGGGIKLTPLASLDEECLDICIFSTSSRFHYLWYLVKCYFGRSTSQMAGVIYLKAKSIQAASLPSRSTFGEPLVQVDGELLGQLPMDFRPIPAAVSLVVP